MSLFVVFGLRLDGTGIPRRLEGSRILEVPTPKTTADIELLWCRLAEQEKVETKDLLIIDWHELPVPKPSIFGYKYHVSFFCEYRNGSTGLSVRFPELIDPITTQSDLEKLVNNFQESEAFYTAVRSCKFLEG